MKQSPSYFRARLDVFRELIHQAPAKSQELVLLRNGVIQDKEQEQLLIKTKLNNGQYPDHELSFFELCCFNTWFAMNPEKVCGEEHTTTSKHFPLSIKGNRKLIESVINKTINPSTNSSDELINKNLEIEALALEIELELQQL